MKGSRLVWQLYGAFAALIAITLLIFGLLVMQQFQADSVRENRQSLELKARLIRNLTLPYLRQNQGLPDADLSDLASILGDRITVIAADGKVLSDSQRDPESMDDHSSRPEILQAKTAGIGISQRFSQTLGKDMHYLALRIEEQGSIRGFVRVSIPQAGFNERLFEMRDGIIMSALAIGIFALVLGYILANQFTKPLVHMTEVASRMAEGDYEQRLPRIGRGEIGELSRALNQLATSSAERISTIREERNQLSAILSGLVEGVIAIDRDQRIIHVNGAAARMLGVKQDEIINELLWEAFRIGELIQAADRVLNDEEFVQTQFHRNALSVELTAVPLKDPDNRVSGAVIVLNDVTEIRRFETVRSDFVANASHELKTPITAIRGLIETVIDDSDMTREDQERFADRIRRQAIRLGSIVGDLLTLSRFDSPFPVPEMQLIDMVKIVNREIVNSSQFAQDKNITLVSDEVTNSVVVNGDEKALLQMVSNLIDNALKYTSDGGQIKIELGSDESWAHLSVSDTGIGIPEEEQQRVFERFYRVDKARSTELGGTGLGLSIVRHIALAHGGDVSVSSTPGSGSVFKVKLPLAGMVRTV